MTTVVWAGLYGPRTGRHTKADPLIIPAGVGEAVAWPWSWRLAYQASPGDPLVIPGGWNPATWGATLTVRDRLTGAVLTTLTKASGALALSTATDSAGARAVVTLQVPAATTSTWVWRHGTFTLTLTRPAGDPILLADGWVAVADA